VTVVAKGIAAWLAASFALVIREGRRSQRAKQDALARFPESRALDPLRGRRVMGGSPELFGEIALRERLEQTGVPGSARILSVTDVSTDSEFPPEVDLVLVDPAQPEQLVIEWMAQPQQNPAG
jgi:hypothetical protein